RALTDDVARQLVELELLVLDHRLDQVADGDHAEHAVAVDHRQVADAPVGDQLHATVGGLVQANRDDIGGHDLAHRRVARGTPLEHDLARVITLGHDPGELAGLHHQQRADALFRHQPDRVDDRVVRADRENPRRLGLQQLPYGAHRHLLCQGTAPSIPPAAMPGPDTAAAAWIPCTA